MPCVVTLGSRDEKFVYDRGSSFKLYFTNEVGNKIKDFTWLGIDTAESWKYVLLTNTPLGYIKGFDETHDIFFDLVIVTLLYNFINDAPCFLIRCFKAFIRAFDFILVSTFST